MYQVNICEFRWSCTYAYKMRSTHMTAWRSPCATKSIIIRKRALNICKRDIQIWKRALNIHEKDLGVYVFMTYVSRKEPYVSGKEPYKSAEEPIPRRLPCSANSMTICTHVTSSVTAPYTLCACCMHVFCACVVWCVRCLLITESPKTPHHYRYQI